MKANDYLWVALKALGVYFSIAGFSTLASTSYFFANSQSANPAADYMKDALLTQAISGGAQLLAGVMLFCCVSMIVKRSRDEEPHES